MPSYFFGDRKMKCVFRCQLSGMKKELKFRQLNLKDEIEIQESFPNYANEITTTEINMATLTAILYMAVMNKELLEPITRQEYDNKGELVDVKLGGIDLFREYVLTDGDQKALLCAFIEVLKKSRPETDKLVKKKMKSKRLIFSLSLMLLVAVTAGAITKLWL